MNHKTVLSLSLAGCLAIATGLGAAAIPGEASAAPLGLIGYCNGQLMTAEEESAFPANGCAWIERVATIEDGGKAWRKANGGRRLRLESTS